MPPRSGACAEVLDNARIPCCDGTLPPDPALPAGWRDPWNRDRAEDEKEKVMILAFPLALIGLAFLTYVTVAVR
jgi:hypothetical protein